MTTPAINVSYYVPRGFTEKRYDAAGNIVSQRHDIDSILKQKRVRPESKSTPVRPDGTRKPQSWNSQWLHSDSWTGHLTMLASPGSPTSHRGEVEGNLTLSRDPTQSISSVDPILRNARLKALAKVTADSMQFNAALRQMDDTFKLTADFASAAANGLDKMMLDQQVNKRGKKVPFWKTAGKLSSWKKIPDRYLAYLFGIAPLAEDLSNGVDQLIEMKDLGLDLYLYLRAKETRRESVSARADIHNGSGGFVIGEHRGRREMSARVGYRFDVPRWFLEKAPILSPFSQAYELTRMSFVLDWIAPVGNWIGACESAQFSPFFKEGFETLSIVDTYTDLVNTSPNPTVKITSNGELIKGQMARNAVLSYPSAVLTRPALNPLPSWRKAAVSLSLLTQAFKRWY